MVVRQHRSYTEPCECARLSEIVGGIGGKSVIIIRYNPDVVRNKGKKMIIPREIRLKFLLRVLRKELDKEYDTFCVKIIQLFYNDNYQKYRAKKSEDITDIVAV